MRYFVIPARKGSKGLPYKNRKLLKYTLDVIPREEYKNTIISTDDELIMDRVKDTDIIIVERSKELASDTASLKPVLIEVIKKCNLKDDDDIIMLILTYPGRTYKEVEDIYNFYKEHNGKTLLCAFKVKSHPYLSFYRLDNHKGKPIIKHQLYRRQDYPKCFRSSHYICIAKVGYIENIGLNMYNEETLFYDIEDKNDVDTEEEFNEFLEMYEKRSQ